MVINKFKSVIHKCTCHGLDTGYWGNSNKPLKTTYFIQLILLEAD